MSLKIAEHKPTSYKSVSVTLSSTMHAFAVLSLVASTALVAAQQETYEKFSPLTTFGTLQARQQQSCSSLGGKACGNKCIQLTYTCCGNGQGACELGYTCGIAANGIYGCCPIGKRCRGDAPEPSTTIIGGSRPTSSVDAGDDDEPTSEAPTTSATSTTTRRLTPASTSSTPARTTTPVSDDDESSSSSSSSSTAVATGGSGGNTGGGSSGNGSGSNGNGSGSNGNGGSGSGSTTTAASGGGGGSASAAGMVTASFASIAGGFIAAIAALL